ncbi:MAG: DUF1512 domain-containing protein [Nitrososphaeraceae archaeon]
MGAFFLQQLNSIFGPGGGSDSGSNPLTYILWFAPIFVLMIYGQKLQSWMILNDISKSLAKLKTMKEISRREAIDYIKTSVKPSIDPSEKIDNFLEYFTIMPVDLDPNGIIGKLDHVMRIKDERIRSEIKRMADGITDTHASRVENILEAATALNMIFKVVRHFYLMGKRTTNMFVLVQLQMVMPLLLQEAEALQNGISAFKNGQPIGDSIGPMVVGKMMVGKEKKMISRETLYTEDEYQGRKVYLLKAEGPGGAVGRPGEGIQRLAGEMGLKIDVIIMIDAALKLEGEKTGAIAEGIGAAIGGIGVERYQIEDIATRFNIPVYAVIVKESIQDAISIMRKEISDSFDKVSNTVFKVIEDKTCVGQSILVVGVGNTLGVAQ